MDLNQRLSAFGKQRHQRPIQKRMELLHKGLTDQVIKTFHDVYNELDFGFMEKVYQNALFLELKSRGSKEDNR